MESLAEIIWKSSFSTVFPKVENRFFLGFPKVEENRYIYIFSISTNGKSKIPPVKFGGPKSAPEFTQEMEFSARVEMGRELEAAKW